MNSPKSRKIAQSKVEIPLEFAKFVPNYTSGSPGEGNRVWLRHKKRFQPKTRRPTFAVKLSVIAHFEREEKSERE
jgi:hypothetical protein